MADRCAPFDGKIDPRVGFVFFFVAIVGLVMTWTDVIGDLLRAHAAAADWGAGYVSDMGLALIAATPMIMLAFAAGAVFRIGLLWAQGHRASEPMAKLVEELGGALLSAAVWSAFLAPNLLRWIPGEGGFTFQFSEFAVATSIAGVMSAAGTDMLRDAARKQAETELFV